MIQFNKICGVGLPRLALAAMFVATGAQAQIVDDTLARPILGSIQWSKNAGASYKLLNLTGSYYDNQVTATEADTGRTYQQYVKTVTAATFTVDGAGKVNNGSLVNALTWTGAADEDLSLRGGSFTLSNLHWNLLGDGSAQVLATVSGTGIVSKDLIAFTTPAAAVTNANLLLTFSQLYMPTDTFALWAQALGADANGLSYPALNLAASQSLGSLRVGVSAVPEPAAWLQVGLGLLVLGSVLQRRSQR